MSCFVALFTSISLYFRWDLAYRFVGWLSPASRRELLWRALALEEVEQVSFRSAGRHWTAPLSAGVTLGLFRDGHFQGPQVDAAAAWILRQGLLRPGRDVVVDAAEGERSSEQTARLAEFLAKEAQAREDAELARLKV